MPQENDRKGRLTKIYTIGIRRIFLLSLTVFLLSGCLSNPLSERSSQEDSYGAFKVEDHKNTLYMKAIALDGLIQKRHLTPEGFLAPAIRINFSNDEEYEVMGFSDMAIWSGCYVAAQAFRYAVKEDQETIEQIMKSIKGLSFLQEITGKRGLLARGIQRFQFKNPPVDGEWHRSEGKYSAYQWLGDVSIDQMNGVIFGLAVVFDLVNDPLLKKSISLQVRNIADHLIDHDMTIEDIDGKRTKHGDLRVGLFSEPLNALIALAIFKTTYYITGEEDYQRVYLDLIQKKKYHKYAVRARDPWWEFFMGANHSDNNLAFLAYYTLIRHEKDPALLKFYIKSLERAWGVVKEEGNPLFTFIYYATHPERVWTNQKGFQANETLYLFREDRRALRFENSKLPNICKAWKNDRFGREQACFPVPMDQRPADYFEWKENPYRMDGGGNKNIEFSGVDYLLPYWMGRYHGFIPPEI